MYICANELLPSKLAKQHQAKTKGTCKLWVLSISSESPTFSPVFSAYMLGWTPGINLPPTVQFCRGGRDQRLVQQHEAVTNDAEADISPWQPREQRGSAGTSLGGTISPPHVRTALLKGSTAQPRIHLAARKASASHPSKTPALLTQSWHREHPGKGLPMSEVLLIIFTLSFFFPLHIFLSWSPAPKGVTASQTPPDSRLQQHHSASEYISTGNSIIMRRNLGRNGMLLTPKFSLSFHANFCLINWDQHPCTACLEA